MDDHRLSFPACVIAGKTALDAADMDRLRRYAFPEGLRSRRDVIALLGINNLCPVKCAEWRNYVIESVTLYLVDGSEPRGIIDDVWGRWLESLLASDGAIHSTLELEIVLHVLETARSVPEFLSTLALDQLRLAVCEDRGAYRHWRNNAGSGVGLDDLTFIYRILRGCVARGKVVLSAPQIEILTRIERETPAGRVHHPGWHDLLSAIVPSEVIARTGKARWLNVPDHVLLEGVRAA
ncbi:hypothetical protein [Ciceribacter sp. L1K22]|uniref:hypothetical protein n=1 Tax=Ciceribacter sp. L1K22 TaxID=2820275 RepID=UPI001ABDFD05|nr:hypothetical protein [Ciceribacter sp. L1K22]MBO3760499.1 hypothetical protein [Ciceribacter sp. L1K22]